jgi:hypothetical protein
MMIRFPAQVRNQEGCSVLTLKWTTAWHARFLWLGASVHLATLAGCGQSSGVRDLPEASKKVLTQRKVDAVKQPPASSAGGQGLPKGRSNLPVQ